VLGDARTRSSRKAPPAAGSAAGPLHVQTSTSDIRPRTRRFRSARPPRSMRSPNLKVVMSGQTLSATSAGPQKCRWRGTSRPMRRAGAATRPHEDYGSISQELGAVGAGPRAIQTCHRCQARAVLRWQFLRLDRRMCGPAPRAVLRHRILPSFAAEAEASTISASSAISSPRCRSRRSENRRFPIPRSGGAGAVAEPRTWWRGAWWEGLFVGYHKSPPVRVQRRVPRPSRVRARRRSAHRRLAGLGAEEQVLRQAFRDGEPAQGDAAPRLLAAPWISATDA